MTGPATYYGINLHTLAAWTFYGLLIFGAGGGSIFWFRIGQMGGEEFRRVLLVAFKKLPEVTDKEALQHTVSAFGLPTSVADLLFSLTPAGLLWTLMSHGKSLVRNPGLAFSAAIIGGLIGRLWYSVSLPLLGLNFALSIRGVSYEPHWAHAYHIGAADFMAASLILLMVSYGLGAKRASSNRTYDDPQRTYDAARIRYDRMNERYWFEHRREAPPGMKQQRKLSEILAAFDGLLEKLGQPSENHGQTPDSEPTWQQEMLARQRVMMVHYQRARVLAALRRYDDALNAVRESARMRVEREKQIDMLDLDRDARDAEINDLLHTQSLQVFLEGALLAAQGNCEDARELFQQSLMIDEMIKDSDGAETVRFTLTKIADTQSDAGIP